MAKESYPYKIIQSGYALSSPHKVFKSCTTPMTSQAIISYFKIFKTFSIFTQYMSVSHGHSTIGGIEWWLWRRQKRERQSHINQAYQRAMEMPINSGIKWWLWRRQKGEDSLTSTRHINRLWRCPSIDINVSEQGLPCNGCTRAISI